MTVKPKKNLGQHFLKDEGIAQKIADLLDDTKADTIIEIGPGMGVLTKPLLQKFGERLHVVEIDDESVTYLNTHFPELEGRVHHADFLKLDIPSVFPGSIAVIGNYPYNISSQILFHLLKFPTQVLDIAGMFQREVARRVTMEAGSKEYGILSVLLAVYYQRKYCFTVSEGVFHPRPKVKSGVLHLKRIMDEDAVENFSGFKAMVKMAFNQRRKTLRNSLRSYGDLPQNELFQKRPEQLGLPDFLKLFEIIESGPFDAR